MPICLAPSRHVADLSERGTAFEEAASRGIDIIHMITTTLQDGHNTYLLASREALHKDGMLRRRITLNILFLHD